MKSMNLGVNKHKRTLEYKWLLSYLLVLIIPIIMSTYIGYIMNETLLKETEASNFLFVDRFKQILDRTSEDLDDMYLETISSSSISKLLRSQQPLQGEDMYEVLQLSDDMAENKLNKDDIHDYYVYVNNIDAVIFDQDPYNLMLNGAFYHEYHESDFWSYEEWVNIVAYPQDKRIIQQFDEDRQYFYLFFVKSTRVIDGSGFANVCMRLDIGSLLSQTVGDRHGSVMIMDQNDKIIMATSPMTLPDELTYEMMAGARGKVEFDAENMIVSYIASDYEQWKYIYVLPTDIYTGTTRYFRNLTFIVMALGLAVSTFLAYYIVKKNYRPIKSIIDLMDEQNQEVDSAANELVYIRESIEDIIHRKNELVSLQRSTLTNEYFIKLLKGQSVIDDDAYRAESLGVEFDSELFAVAVVYIDAFDENVYKGQEDASLIRLVITNVLTECLGESYKAYFVDADNLLYCILNPLDNRQDILEESSELTEILNEAIGFLNNRLSIKLTLGISNWHHHISNIQTGYSEATEVIEYKYVIGDSLLLHTEIVGRRTSALYYLPAEYDKRLLTAIKRGHYEDGRTMIEDIFKKNFETDVLSPSAAKLLVYELVTTLIKVYNQTNTALTDDMEQLQALVEMDNLMDVKRAILQTVEVICEANRSIEDPEDHALRYDVWTYIEENYTDAGLNISSIADNFKLHPYYLSKIYKEEYGESILDTLTRIRVEKGKELLESYTVEEVADKVGYTNARTFTRNFKKVVGVTPGKYKE